MSRPTISYDTISRWVIYGIQSCSLWSCLPKQNLRRATLTVKNPMRKLTKTWRPNCKFNNGMQRGILFFDPVTEATLTMFEWLVLGTLYYCCMVLWLCGLVLYYYHRHHLVLTSEVAAEFISLEWLTIDTQCSRLTVLRLALSHNMNSSKENRCGCWHQSVNMASISFASDRVSNKKSSLTAMINSSWLAICPVVQITINSLPLIIVLLDIVPILILDTQGPIYHKHNVDPM